jgi:hypothetical protein
MLAGLDGRGRHAQTEQRPAGQHPGQLADTRSGQGEQPQPIQERLAGDQSGSDDQPPPPPRTQREELTRAAARPRARHSELIIKRR